MAAKILDGTKTVTRRRGKKRWNVGAIHQCYTRPPFAKGGAEPFARVRIVSVQHERRVGASLQFSAEAYAHEREALREGFDYGEWEAFLATYCELNGAKADRGPCWRVAFALVSEEA
jgi:hypothetical protein